MTIQQMLLRSPALSVLPLTDVDLYAHVIYLPPSIQPARARYLFAADGTVSVASSFTTATPNVLPEQWLPDGANFADYRARFTVTSRNPAGTVVDVHSTISLGQWFQPSSASWVEVSSDSNGFLYTMYEATVRLDIAPASDLTNILGGANITLRFYREPIT